MSIDKALLMGDHKTGISYNLEKYLNNWATATDMVVGFFCFEDLRVFT